jgi:hypothetical protein
MGGSRQLGVQIDSNKLQLGSRGSGGSVMASDHGSGSGMDDDSDIIIFGSRPPDTGLYT